MNSDTLLIIIFIGIMTIVVVSIALAKTLLSSNTRKLIDAAKVAHAGREVFICGSLEPLDLDSGPAVQIYGDLVAGTLKKGMRLHYKSIDYEIIDVYGSEEVPEEPSETLDPFALDSAVILRAGPGTYETLKADVKINGTIILGVSA